MDMFKGIKKTIDKKDKKKLIENTVIVIIIGIIILIAGTSFFSKKKTPEAGSYVKANEAAEASASADITFNDTERKLKEILSNVKGAGKVDVMITYSASKESIPAYDTKTSENSTDEKDSGGGTRKIAQSSSESTIVFQDGQNGGKTPVLIRENEPVVKGVLVIAEGASEPEVKNMLGKAVQVVLDVPLHKIEIIERKK